MSQNFRAACDAAVMADEKAAIETFRASIKEAHKAARAQAQALRVQMAARGLSVEQLIAMLDKQ